MAYDATDIDLVWMAQMLEILSEGGIMVFPSSGLIYKVSHKNKTLTLQNPALLDVGTNRKLHEMTRIVISFFYYELKEATQ